VTIKIDDIGDSVVEGVKLLVENGGYVVAPAKRP
jgi:hypothetical protein